MHLPHCAATVLSSAVPQTNHSAPVVTRFHTANSDNSRSANPPAPDTSATPTSAAPHTMRPAARCDARVNPRMPEPRDLDDLLQRSQREHISTDWGGSVGARWRDPATVAHASVPASDVSNCPGYRGAQKMQLSQPLGLSCRRASAATLCVPAIPPFRVRAAKATRPRGASVRRRLARRGGVIGKQCF